MVVHYHLRFRVVVHGIDGEVAPCCVFFHRAPHVVAQHPARTVYRMRHAGQLALAGSLVTAHLFGLAAVQICAEGRHFNDFVLAATAVNHVNNAKTPANDESATKQAFDFFWRGIGGHVEVFGFEPHQ